MDKKIANKELDKVSAGLSEHDLSIYKSLLEQGRIDEAKTFLDLCIKKERDLELDTFHPGRKAYLVHEEIHKKRKK